MGGHCRLGRLICGANNSGCHVGARLCVSAMTRWRSRRGHGASGHLAGTHRTLQSVLHHRNVLKAVKHEVIITLGLLCSYSQHSCPRPVTTSNFVYKKQELTTVENSLQAMRLVPCSPQSAVISKARVLGRYCTVTSVLGQWGDRHRDRAHDGT